MSECLTEWSSVMCKRVNARSFFYVFLNITDYYSDRQAVIDMLSHRNDHDFQSLKINLNILCSELHTYVTLHHSTRANLLIYIRPHTLTAARIRKH